MSEVESTSKNVHEAAEVEESAEFTIVENVNVEETVTATTTDTTATTNDKPNEKTQNKKEENAASSNETTNTQPETSNVTTDQTIVRGGKKFVEEIEDMIVPVQDQVKQKMEKLKADTTKKLEAAEKEIEEKEKDIKSKAETISATAAAMKGAAENKLRSNAITECPVNKEEALYAVNVVRSLHGVPDVSWSDELAEEAQKHALNLAQTKSRDLSGKENIGENIYIAKRTSKCPNVCHAVLEWYKTVTHFKFKSINTMPSQETLTFTQLVWDDTKKIGMGCVYAEETMTSYIVANFSPPGNYGDYRNYVQHVKDPKAGLPPRVPKIDDLITKSGSGECNSGPSNMGSIFGMLCHWCVSLEDKPEVTVSSAKPKVFANLKESDSDLKTTDEPADQKATSSHEDNAAKGSTNQNGKQKENTNNNDGNVTEKIEDQENNKTATK